MLTAKIKGLDKVLFELDKWTEEIKKQADEIVKDAAIHTKDEAVKNLSRKYPEGAVDTGILRGSMSFQKDSTRPHVYLVGAIGKRADEANRYARWVELGRRPGKMPPVGDSPEKGLWRWVLRHGWYNKDSVKRGGKPSVFELSKNKAQRLKEARSIAFAIAKSIKKKGMRPRPYLLPAYQKGVARLLINMGKHFK